MVESGAMHPLRAFLAALLALALLPAAALAAGGPFETLDGEPASIFIATLSPPEDANSHIRFLAVVTRQLANRRVREKVLEAATKEDLVAAFEKPEGAAV